MRNIEQHARQIYLIVLLLLLVSFMLAACSGEPEATKPVDALNLADAEPTTDVTMPKAVLTIPPTKSPMPTTTLRAPTATQKITLIQTATQPAETPTNIPTDSPTSTEIVHQNLSACPQGCSEPTAGCLIKGNINNEGVKIYHSPGQSFYDETKISPEKGERWFCTPAEAEANGWRASKR